MDSSPSTRLPGRLVPAGGGHVPVRVRGLVGPDVPREPGRRFAVALARTDHGVVKVLDGATVLGYLPAIWSQEIDFELWSCEQAGEPALARAVLEGGPGERELFVLLAWRQTRR